MMLTYTKTKTHRARKERVAKLTSDVHNENMFTTNLEDGCEAPSKARKKGAKRLEFLVYI